VETSANNPHCKNPSEPKTITLLHWVSDPSLKDSFVSGVHFRGCVVNANEVFAYDFNLALCCSFSAALRTIGYSGCCAKVRKKTNVSFLINGEHSGRFWFGMDLNCCRSEHMHVVNGSGLYYERVYKRDHRWACVLTALFFSCCFVICNTFSCKGIFCR